ncbi:MAG: hypothetical protein ACP5LA_05220 [Thermoplasmata archaeon]|nr:hypothetical protein [Thermoplasmata archaeon]
MVHVIILNPKRIEYEVENVKYILDIFKKLNINLDGYIALKNGKPVPEDDPIDENSTLELLQVFSGG